MIHTGLLEKCSGMMRKGKRSFEDGNRIGEIEKRIDRIFPSPFPIEIILDAMSDAGFQPS